MACRKSEAGFSLMELAIVIVIIGLLTTPLLQIYNNQREQERLDKTEIAISAVTNALGAYYMEHGFYPCPADRTIGYNDEDAGVGDCSKLTDLTVNTCSPDSGTCSVTGDPGTVFVGAVPYVDLKILYSDVIDGNKFVLSYSVSADFTDPATADDASRLGAISLTKERVDESGAVTAETIDNIHYVLVSHGEDGFGAFDVNGQDIDECKSAYKDGENCDLDADYLDRGSLRSDPLNSEHYDDRVEAIASQPTSLWLRSIETPGAVYNTNAGAIGIGTKTPTDGVKLDVDGIVKASNFQGQYYCDEDGNNCFATETIAGTGITCPSGYMIGIANNNVQCAPAQINVNAGTCGEEQYVSGIDSGGNIECADLP